MRCTDAWQCLMDGNSKNGRKVLGKKRQSPIQSPLWLLRDRKSIAVHSTRLTNRTNSRPEGAREPYASAQQFVFMCKVKSHDTVPP